MMIRKLGVLALAAVTIVAVPLQLQAQENAKPAAILPEAKAIFDRARNVYKLIKFYHNTAKVRFEMRAKDAEGKEVNEDDPEDLTFAYAAPRRFFFKHEVFAIYSDGATQTGYDVETKRYVQKPTVDGLLDEVKTEDIELVCAIHIPANLILTPDKFEKSFPFFTEVTSVKGEAFEGKPGKRVYGKGTLPRMPFDETFPMTMWFADSSGLIVEFTMDLKPIYDKMDETLKIERASGIITYSNPVIDMPIQQDVFSFKPTEQDLKVETLIEEEEPDAQLSLVGKPAPDFKGLDLDGKPLGLADLKGKIVLLDFWANKPPCMDTLPKIQELWTELGGKDVVVIGVNEDEPESREDVKRVIESKKITYRQLMDIDGEVAASYFVEAVPCWVLIDAKGVVQWVNTGAVPNFKQEIASRIAKLRQDGAGEKEPAKK